MRCSYTQGNVRVLLHDGAMSSRLQSHARKSTVLWFIGHTLWSGRGQAGRPEP